MKPLQIFIPLFFHNEWSSLSPLPQFNKQCQSFIYKNLKIIQISFSAPRSFSLPILFPISHSQLLYITFQLIFISQFQCFTNENNFFLSQPFLKYIFFTLPNQSLLIIFQLFITNIKLEYDLNALSWFSFIHHHWSALSLFSYRIHSPPLLNFSLFPLLNIIPLPSIYFQ